MFLKPENHQCEVQGNLLKFSLILKIRKESLNVGIILLPPELEVMLMIVHNFYPSRKSGVFPKWIRNSVNSAKSANLINQ